MARGAGQAGGLASAAGGDVQKLGNDAMPEQRELRRQENGVRDRQGLRYLVTKSIAPTGYGQPRCTHEGHTVVPFKPKQPSPFWAECPPPRFNGTEPAA